MSLSKILEIETIEVIEGNIEMIMTEVIGMTETVSLKDQTGEDALVLFQTAVNLIDGIGSVKLAKRVLGLMKNLRKRGVIHLNQKRENLK